MSPSTPSTWSIGCLALPEGRRGQGLAAEVIAAVVERARSAGARVVEAYPVRPWDEPRSYRGHHRTYLGLGFREIAAERDGGAEILLLQRELASAS